MALKGMLWKVKTVDFVPKRVKFEVIRSFGLIVCFIFEPRHQKTCLCHLRSLISAFVVHFLDSIVYAFAIS